MNTSIKKTEEIHTIIIGAGPAGLAAAYALSKRNIAPVIIEKDASAGGLMRSLSNGNFIMDVGRKELYTRIAKVDTLWREILKDDYVEYSHREGILYQGHILETSSRWRGLRRGMPWSMIWQCGIDYLRSCLLRQFRVPANYEDYWYRKRGKRLSQILSQGFEEKFKGIKWAELPLPKDVRVVDDSEGTRDKLLDQHMLQHSTPIWRHPAKGTGQICDILARESKMAGAMFKFKSNVMSITTSKSRVETINIAEGSEVITYHPEHVIFSGSIEMMTRTLDKNFSPDQQYEPKEEAPSNLSMTTICVYLFLDEPPRFPHVWLKVTSPEMKIGRITNYSAFNGRMVPKGKTCLCVEYFCTPSNSMLALDDKELHEHTIFECVNASLIDARKCFGISILKLFNTRAATNWRDWDDPRQHKMLDLIGKFDNLYYINRPGTDKATYAGLEAAEAIFANDREVYFKEMALSLPSWKRA